MNEESLAERLHDRLFGGGHVEVIVDPPDVVDWAQDRFYITETKRPIVLEPIQKTVLRMFSERLDNGRFRWKTCLYSTIKKSGKTTMAALYQRWAAEGWGDFGEIYHLGNKRDQAKARAFKLTRYSIELAPPSERAEWDIQTLSMTHITSRSFIQALPVNAAGEAGGNQRLTTWTEFHGYKHEENERMWTEMQPVPTQHLSQRFVESYAGYTGESMLLYDIWQLAEAGERLHDEYPIYGNVSAGLIAYIDTGEDARRMPWQRGEAGRQYYAEQATIESDAEYKRLHLNDWVSSQSTLIDIELWDQLEIESPYLPHEKPRVVVAVDASVSGDCTALSVVSYMIEDDIVIELETRIWEPEKGNKLDYELTFIPVLEALIRTGRVVCVAYDEYQLHNVMTQLQKKYRRVKFFAFGQGNERLKADTSLLNRMRQRTILHSGNPQLRQHVQNADAKEKGESAIRIVKRGNKDHVDAVVALSMAAWKGAELLKRKPLPNMRNVRVRYD